MKVPDAFYVAVGDGTQALAMPIVGPVLRQLSNKFAADLDHQLHHADWRFTVDPAVVREVSIMHDCARCRAGCDRALAALAEHPDEDLACGVLYWV